MYTAIVAIHILVSIVLIITVLLQTGKGASIGATFGGASSQTLFGSAGPATFLMKVTIGCAAVFIFTSVYLTFISRSAGISSIMTGTPAVKELKKKPEKAPEPKEAAKPQKKTEALKPAPIVKEKKAAPEKNKKKKK